MMASEMLMEDSVWFYPRSVLTNASGSYFAARFGSEAMLPAGAERTDQYGRSIYFIARDGQLFGKYILPYMVTNEPGELPSFSERPQLWRLLRKEATFCGLDGLSYILSITNTFTPEKNGDRGVLYWLGTNKGTQEYQNPYKCRNVDVTGWVDMNRSDYQAIGEEYDDGEDSVKTLASLPSSRRALVHYRPLVKGVSVAGSHILEARNTCYLLFCEHDARLNPVVIDLKSVWLNLTAYSLRADGNCEMPDWNLEGSVDGSDWEVIHEARDESVSPPSTGEVAELMRETAFDQDEQEILVFLLSCMERKHRHLFRIEQDDDDTAVFHRYIRLTGCKDTMSCLHGRWPRIVRKRSRRLRLYEYFVIGGLLQR